MKFLILLLSILLKDLRIEMAISVSGCVDAVTAADSRVFLEMVAQQILIAFPMYSLGRGGSRRLRMLTDIPMVQLSSGYFCKSMSLWAYVTALHSRALRTSFVDN